MWANWPRHVQARGPAGAQVGRPAAAAAVRQYEHRMTLPQVPKTGSARGVLAQRSNSACARRKAAGKARLDRDGHKGLTRRMQTAALPRS